MKFKKNIIIIIVSALIMILLVKTVLLPTIRYAALTCMQAIATAGDYNSDYITIAEALSSFAKESDYQQWLVSSGDTITGRIVLFAVVCIEVGLFSLCSIIFSSNLNVLKKKVLKYINFYQQQTIMNMRRSKKKRF